MLILFEYACALVDRSGGSRSVRRRIEPAGGKQAGFDFAVAEECVRFQECDSYTEVYGDLVIDIEYTDNLDGDFRQMCGRPGTLKATILRDRKLVPAGDPAYVYQRC